ncbi:uracil-DNA glycosylase [Labedella gwakjiensis]|uniref:Uracil-DNA glycosylase n=1 Tax=Labedella gwakjiensis TaxID=390269 RepID=A0A2P8GZ34_9MICO|nr:uracil-DNA glycosylase family protein [Labedella gwakjiensis]PSL39217.1 uracil-DNA glycosylase [Labedella gwakjiensis]RUQ86356.1 uracil-DNA glycosylase family protein [Labedella gwakjiensis]
MTGLDDLRAEIAAHPSNDWATEQGWAPLVVGSPASRVLLISQAPGRRAQESGIPWNDASGVRLRSWLGVTDEEFYDASRFAIVPMDFYYPGKAASGDKPPRPGVAPLWHPRVLEQLTGVRATILVGSYAQRYYLGSARSATLTETVRRATDFAPSFPIVHPSPLTLGWQRRNPWYDTETLPALRAFVRRALD